jgi:2',3'-cyclic-nucleotide 2'-phosphodiesterase (5'-nucleotidase family)
MLRNETHFVGSFFTVQYISSSDKVKIFDEVQGVRDEAERLKKIGVNILIAVGHAGYLKDMEIAGKVSDIDVVVGGHTNTFLWNGNVKSRKIEFLILLF